MLIPDEEKEDCRYLVVTKIIQIFLRNNVKNNGDMYCLKCCHSLRTKNSGCENKDFCGIVMLSEKKNTLKFNQYMKADKMLIQFVLMLNL